ncbi:helix-turn-helix transcriptional regulator [Streptomyces violaceoruber]|uniref:Transcriptional regulator n=3 Tax=Streptomyces TaxID=1883 RepID=Q93JA0_STRCO|nr:MULTISPECIES: helix-turn-helix transcriptional regulator [Streptomyces]MYU46999.1 helix-turn-helix domain-containing protein [Streptomyces sp. SID7813]MDX2924437.1 helix-turn-helix transcriptional regulator [Streptomyces sp. NRRL_B-16638]MDX3365955.1 helix-turn-helix transcriptional regulator [Streptomyces sp. ME02-6987-2C]MDX3399229.1 helix-turn-helix transcriptional regulator [Streptomyces sp. ME01-18h]MDX3405784.1 helix-turn-helix transcriptional regulator [Streptomyces sp. ME02-6977A]
MKNVPLADVDHVDRAVLPIGTDYPPGHVLDWHEHRRAQFLYGATGVMVVDTGDGTWTVPPERAVLIPAATRHRVRMLGVSTRSLYIEPDAVPWWPGTCTVVDVPPLLRELLLTAVEFEADYSLSGRAGSVADLLLHEIAARAPLPFHVRIPAGADLAALCREYLAAPDTGVTNAVWAARTNMSERAFTRRFRAETGDSPAVWRGRARLLAAVPLLRSGSVSEVGGRLGYASPAAFTAAFTRTFGIPPSRFAQGHRGRPG